MSAEQDDAEGADAIWSEIEQPEDEADEEVGPVRRHALWALLVLFFAAAIAGSLMVLLGGGGGHHRQAIIEVPVDSTTQPTTPATAAGSSTASPTDQQPSSASTGRAPAFVIVGTSLPASPGARGNPCGRQSSCLVPGDGGAVAAVNDFRTRHHLSPVRGVVTSDAQRCAQTHGAGPTCVPHYAYTVLPWQDGDGAIEKVNSFNSDWLTDPGIKRIEIGWWYVGGSYDFAILKAP